MMRRRNDLTALREATEKAGWSFDATWNDIRELVHMVMRAHLTFTEDPVLNMGALDIPKILGFDFIVNPDRKPFLLEVTVCRVGATRCKRFLRQASRGL
jgi:hypothetical protein